MAAATKTTRKRSEPDFIIAPYTIVCDSREQAPWRFTGFKADAKHKYRDLVIPTKVAGLQTGDYSLLGHENRIAIERKSLDDAYGTFGGDRERFERELERLQQMEYAAVVIEAGWGSILNAERPVSALGRSFTPKMFYRSVVTWQVRYPGVHWWACETRSFAERTCWHLLQRFWEERRCKAAPARDSHKGA